MPFEFTNFADTVGGYLKEIARLTDGMRDETKLMNRLIKDGSVVASEDPRETFIVPKPKDEVPFLNFAPLQNAIAKLEESAKRYDSAMPRGASPSPRLNEALYKTERALTSKAGLPGRDWFRHQIYAPGFYTGYGVKTLPAVREAIEQRDWKLASEQIEKVAALIENYAAEIDAAAALKAN